MAKTTKTKEGIAKIGAPSENVNNESTQVDMPISEAMEKGLFVPDIPAQMESKNEPIVVKKGFQAQITEEIPESDEILFLRRILRIQHEGGFGRHLDELINERIKSLK